MTDYAVEAVVEVVKAVVEVEVEAVVEVWSRAGSRHLRGLDSSDSEGSETSIRC